MTFVLVANNAGRFAALAKAVKESPIMIEYARTDNKHILVIAVLIIGAVLWSTDFAHVSTVYRP
jgi:hypothetical protein